MPKLSLFVFLLELIGTYHNILMLLISSLFSLVIGTVVGLSQLRIKRLLAFSTISHVGFILLTLSISSENSVTSFLFYLVQYSLTNLNTFIILLGFGYLFYKDVGFISELKGLFFNYPLLGLSLAVSLFSMAGIPPLLGFFAKY